MLNHDRTPATPYAQGSGHVDVGRAAQAGLLFDESFADYMAANPDDGRRPEDPEPPVVRRLRSASSCARGRATAAVPVNAAAPVPARRHVDCDVDGRSGPHARRDADGRHRVARRQHDDRGDRRRERSARRRDAVRPDHPHPSNPSGPVVTMPVAVVPTAGVLPDAVDVETRRDAGSHPVTDIESIAVTEFTGSVLGMVRADRRRGSLVQDPTAPTPYDDLDQVDVHLVDVPRRRQPARRRDDRRSRCPTSTCSSAPARRPSPRHRGLRVGHRRATTSTATSPIRPPGTWWVLIQNWEGSTPDRRRLHPRHRRRARRGPRQRRCRGSRRTGAQR